MFTVLQHDPSMAEGLGWVREHYADALPKNIKAGGEADNPHSEEGPGAA